MDSHEEWYCDLIDEFQLSLTLFKIHTLEDFRGCLESFIIEHDIINEPELCAYLEDIGKIKLNVKEIYEKKTNKDRIYLPEY